MHTARAGSPEDGSDGRRRRSHHGGSSAGQSNSAGPQAGEGRGLFGEERIQVGLANEIDARAKFVVEEVGGLSEGLSRGRGPSRMSEARLGLRGPKLGGKAQGYDLGRAHRCRKENFPRPRPPSRFGARGADRGKGGHNGKGNG